MNLQTPNEVKQMVRLLKHTHTKTRIPFILLLSILGNISLHVPYASNIVIISTKYTLWFVRVAEDGSEQLASPNPSISIAWTLGLDLMGSITVIPCVHGENVSSKGASQHP